MSGGHTQQVPVDVEGVEVMLDVTYSYTSGTPEQGPSYASGGEPATGPEIEITGMAVKGQEVPQWFFDAVLDGERVMDWLTEHHDGDDEGDRADRDYDRDRDERMERDNEN